METINSSSQIKQEKSKNTKQKVSMKKLDANSAKILAALKEKANKKDFGKKVLEKDILSLAVRLVTDEHLKELQIQTYTEKDRLLIAHEEFCKQNGKITLDQFIGRLLKGELKA